jgi:hypothetical protein
VVDGVADGRGGAGDADLTDAKYAEWRGRAGVVKAVDVDGLTTVPMSNTPTQRVMRTSMVSGSTRTSQNWAPEAAFTQWRRSRMSLPA